MDFGAMLNRVLRAAMLDVDLYEEVEADTNLTQEALIVVIIVSILGSVGSFISTLMARNIGAALLSLVITVVLGVINYYIWAYVTYFVGTRLFGGTADVGEMLRVLGYASGPRVLAVLSFIPCVGGLITLAGAVWALIAGVIAVRQALDFDTGKAILTVIIGWVIIIIISILISLVVVMCLKAHLM